MQCARYPTGRIAFYLRNLRVKALHPRVRSQIGFRREAADSSAARISAAPITTGYGKTPPERDGAQA